jgi:myo-inositol 2-dehydrogenase/D-chiro-inositol 1-dehydrogenase
MVNWLNPGAEPVEVYAVADALVGAPDFKDAGLLDTAVAVVKFDNGAIATVKPIFRRYMATTCVSKPSGLPA